MPVDTLHQSLKSFFGFDTFRPHQEEIIRHVMDGRDALIIMPTGGGKSICYQLPALLKDGLTLVISPLISLMNDQVRSLKANGISAGALHSGTTHAEHRALLDAIEKKTLNILYVSPERALTQKFLEFAQTLPISLIAIDEAHCVSIWGNDFRPEYAQLPTLTAFFHSAPVIALTATADKATQEDIRQQLQLKSPATFLSSFERHNIFLSARPGVERIEQVREFLQHHQGEAGIIYCLARKTTEQVASVLKRYGYKAEAYHAEIDNAKRKQVQEDFQYDRIQIVCATIAFGMGIDKPNIRWIIHYNLPKNIENYYQEVGRSGRDGQEAQALMFYSFRDVAVYKDFILKSDANETFRRVQEEKLERIWEYSQANHCRTNVILNYFGEYRAEGCGHCDHCQQPPVGFDGTRWAQMALSACKRCDESVGATMLIDVLRGSARREIQERGFHKIKTYGAGRELSQKDWMHYLTEMINQGLMEIDYVHHSVLKCTPLSDQVLFEGRMVTLHKPVERLDQLDLPSKPKYAQLSETLLDRLEALCRKAGREEGLPPYAIFPKGTLREMAEIMPITFDEFTRINGVGEYKSGKYGKMFVDEIRDHLQAQTVVKKAKGATYIETLQLFRRGMTIEDIALERKMATSTIATHLTRLYDKGEDLDFSHLLHKDDLIFARQAWRASGFSTQISKVKEQLGDSMDYNRLHLALAILRREKDLQR